MKNISDNYIIMCKEAQEIQEMRIGGCQQIGDIYIDLNNFENKYIHYSGKNVYSCGVIEEYNVIETKGKSVDLIWIPRQEDLINMLINTGKFNVFIKEEGRTPKFKEFDFKSLLLFIYKEDCFNINYFSFDEVLLNVVMSEIYNKKWDDKKQKWF